MPTEPEVVHVCQPDSLLDAAQYLQQGKGRGESLLVIGEAPAPNGWRISGRAFYSPSQKLLPTGLRLNEWLNPFSITIEESAFTELVKCFIGSNRSLLLGCAIRSWALLDEQVRQTDPTIMLILGKKTHEVFEKCYGQRIPFGVVTDVKLGGKSRSYLAIFHPSPISPTGRARNEIIRNENLAKLNAAFSDRS